MSEAERSDSVVRHTKELMTRRTTTLRHRAERAEAERDEAQAVLERVRGLASEWASSPAVGSSSSEQWEFDTLRTAARDLHEALDRLNGDE